MELLNKAGCHQIACFVNPAQIADGIDLDIYFQKFKMRVLQIILVINALISLT